MMKEPNYKNLVYRIVIVEGEDLELRMYLLIRKGLSKKNKKRNCVWPFEDFRQEAALRGLNFLWIRFAWVRVLEFLELRK